MRWLHRYCLNCKYGRKWYCKYSSTALIVHTSVTNTVDTKTEVSHTYITTPTHAQYSGTNTIAPYNAFTVNCFTVPARRLTITYHLLYKAVIATAIAVITTDVTLIAIKHWDTIIGTY